jgi:heterodisulfide reductase subunit A
MFPNDHSGRDQIADLISQVEARPAITVFTAAELVGKRGTFGNYVADVRVQGETLQLEVGTFVIATGADTYQPETGEFGYGMDGSSDELVYQGRPVRSVAYIYCVGNRQPGGNEYCSKFCCAATVHASLKVAAIDPTVRQFHLHRDVRTYGRYELMYAESRDRGSVYMRYPDDAPPTVTQTGDGRLAVTVLDRSTAAEELVLPVDLVVLVTGMVPRENAALTGLLKLPVSSDGFYNEIHPKLRPVETVVDGVMIAGACQGPKTAAESVASGLAAVTQSGGILKKGFAELDPLVAIVHEAACTGCEECLPACPYEAVRMTNAGDRAYAVIDAATCKGCGGCVPLCTSNAIDLLGHTDEQMLSVIDTLAEELVP